MTIMLAELGQGQTGLRGRGSRGEVAGQLRQAAGVQRTKEALDPVSAAMPLWTVRMMFPKMFIRMCEIIQLMGAGGLVTVPSYAETGSAVWGDVEMYFQSANADSKSRIKLFRLAFDAAVSSFSGRQQLYERYYSGDPVRLAGTLYSIYDRDSYIERVVGMLDSLERRQVETSHGPAFGPKPRAAG